MQRVMVVGSGGAGKSTFARELGGRLGLPVIHLDAEYWQPGWVQTPHEPWDARMRELVAHDRWIMDGNYGRTQEPRMERADTIIVLDYPAWRCIWQVYKRAFRYRGQVRPDLAPGCPEQLPELQFLLWIWRFRRRSRPWLMDRLEKYREGRTIHIFPSPASARRFLDTISPSNRG